jgi:hypothetical protein
MNYFGVVHRCQSVGLNTLSFVLCSHIIAIQDTFSVCLVAVLPGMEWTIQIFVEWTIQNWVIPCFVCFKGFEG